MAKTVGILSKENDLLTLNTGFPDRPIPPVISINENVLALNNNMGKARLVIMLPFMFAGLFLYWNFFSEFKEEWKSHERNTIQYIESKKNRLGDEYFHKTEDEYDLKKYERLNSEGKVPLETYIYYIYNETLYPQKIFWKDVFALSFATFFFIPWFIVLIIQKRVPPLYFDRNKRLVYSWKDGKVWANRYDILTYAYDHQVLQICTRTMYKGQFGWGNYPLQPSSVPYLVSKDQVRKTLAVIAKFMEKGQEEIWDKDWNGKLDFYFREHKKPEDFDEQLADLLEKIDAQVIEDPKTAIPVAPHHI